MSIILQQDLTLQPYPSGNNSYIKFISSISPNRAEIKLSNSLVFPNPFVLYPDKYGRFVFDFKEVAKASFSVKDFTHQGVSSFTWGQSFLGNLATVNCVIKTFNNSTSDSLNKSYTFSKSVRQIGEEYTNQYLLTPQTDSLTYDLTYWEGFPFEFQIQSVPTNDVITVKSLNNGITSSGMTTQLSGGFAIHLDKVSTNWTSSNFLPLNTYLNRLEIYEEGVFKCNLNIWKKEPCKGVYLKWFNNQGGVSYHLFDEFFKDDLKTKNTRYISNNSFENVGELSNTITSTGRTGATKLTLKTTCTKQDLKVLEQLYLSPRIEMYTSQEPYIQGKWIVVELGGASLPMETKRNLTTVKVSINLPEIKTLTL